MIAFRFFGVASEIAKDERPIGKYISIACGAELTLTQLNWTQFIRFGDRETENKNCEPDTSIYINVPFFCMPTAYKKCTYTQFPFSLSLSLGDCFNYLI